jgi:hypothetical protein
MEAEMPHNAVVTFTARPLQEILHDQGSRDWRLDAARARQAEYLICTQNQHNSGFRTPSAPHRAAFLIGRITDVVPSPERPDRWLIKFNECIILDPPILNIWGKFGNLRYPILYITLEELGIDLAALPPFASVPTAGDPIAATASGMSEASGRPISMPLNWPRVPANPATRAVDGASNPDAWRRLDAILAQIDRVPDLPAATEPLDWDEHGLPR